MMEYSQSPTHAVEPSHEADPTESFTLRDARAEFDREYMLRLLRATGGNVRQAAQIADIHPKSFERLMRRRGVRRIRRRRRAG